MSEPKRRAKYTPPPGLHRRYSTCFLRGWCTRFDRSRSGKPNQSGIHKLWEGVRNRVREPCFTCNGVNAVKNSINSGFANLVPDTFPKCSRNAALPLVCREALHGVGVDGVGGKFLIKKNVFLRFFLFLSFFAFFFILLSHYPKTRANNWESWEFHSDPVQNFPRLVCWNNL